MNDNLCYKCNKPGHFSFECPESSLNSHEKTDSFGSNLNNFNSNRPQNRCYKCGQSGHIAKNCNREIADG